MILCRALAPRSLERVSIPAAVSDFLIAISASFHLCFIALPRFFFRPDTLASVTLQRHQLSDSSQSSLSLFPSFHLRTMLVEYIVHNLIVAAAAAAAAAPIITGKPRSCIVGRRAEGATSQSASQSVWWWLVKFPLDETFFSLSNTGSIFWDYETSHASVQAIVGGKPEQRACSLYLALYL